MLHAGATYTDEPWSQTEDYTKNKTWHYTRREERVRCGLCQITLAACLSKNSLRSRVSCTALRSDENQQQLGCSKHRGSGTYRGLQRKKTTPRDSSYFISPLSSSTLDALLGQRSRSADSPTSVSVFADRSAAASPSEPEVTSLGDHVTGAVVSSSKTTFSIRMICSRHESSKPT